MHARFELWCSRSEKAQMHSVSRGVAAARSKSTAKLAGEPHSEQAAIQQSCRITTTLYEENRLVLGIVWTVPGLLLGRADRAL